MRRLGRRQRLHGRAQPAKSFAFPDELQITLAGRLQAVIHSHPDWWPVPSATDMRQQQAMALPWGIIGTDGKACTPITWFGAQAPKGPLIGRGFIHGHQDCKSLLVDWHATQDIPLREHPRDWEWWLNGDDLYRDQWRDYGFEPIDGPVDGAVFLACIGRDADKRPIMVPNHAGIYVGNGLILHHLTTQKPIDPSHLSARQPLGRWARYANAPFAWYRHRDLR
jgi:cell wall-associated NlpC family hydrolase